MDKREFEISKLAIKAKRLESYLGIVRLLLVCGTIVFAIHLILAGIRPIIGQSADQINALASFVQSFHLGSIFGYVLAGIFGVAWAVERKGKHRAIQQKAHFQDIAERNEPNRSSSGLTQTGQSPA
jgi:hypothetical protein